MKKMIGKSRGQIMVLYAVAITGLLGAVALGADVAVMYVNWQQVQKTADAAALAGANFMAGISFAGTPSPGCTGQPDDASKVACTTAVGNGLKVSDVTITEPTTSSIKVVAHRTDLPYFFARAVGLRTYNVSATSVAAAPGNIGTVTQGMFPVGMECRSPCSLANLDPGQTVPFGQKFVGGLAPGNWQWLDVAGTGASNLATNIVNGAPGSYTIGDKLNSATGIKTGQVNTALATRFAKCQSIAEPCTTAAANPTDIPDGDPCLVVIPVVDYKGCSGNCTNLSIEGFALIYLDSTSNANHIDGCFVKSVIKNTISSSTAPGLGGLVVDALTN